jgi:tetratricopeptide (TPR) repeat protein
LSQIRNVSHHSRDWKISTPLVLIASRAFSFFGARASGDNAYYLIFKYTINFVQLLIETISNEELNQIINNNETNESETLSRNLQALKVSFQNKRAGYLQALKAYNKAIAINPKDSYLYSRQGDVLFKLDGCPAAIDSLNKAILMNPVGLFYRQRAIVYLALKELEKAEADYNRYQELDPTSYNADQLSSGFSNKNYLTQWLQETESQKQQLLQLDRTLDFPGDCLSGNY